jgi:ABC-type sugar transport system ATPase subunit
MADVSIRNVTKRFGKSEVIHGVSCDISEGEFIVILGPSGCGKSTLLRLIAGLEEITSGEIAIDGRVVNRLEPAQRDIAMVFQNYALYPHMTVYRNMAYGLRMRGTPKEETDRRVRNAARILELTELLERKPRQLSGGQRQRVAMGRCIVREPKVFLFDEPLSNLDAKLRVQMRLEISKLHEDLKITSIYVTHDQVEAMTLGDRLVVMDNGSAAQIGSPLEVYERPANLFVAGFIGSPAMNFLKATVAAGRPGGGAPRRTCRGRGKRRAEGVQRTQGHRRAAAGASGAGCRPGRRHPAHRRPRGAAGRRHAGVRASRRRRGGRHGALGRSPEPGQEHGHFRYRSRRASCTSSTRKRRSGSRNRLWCLVVGG